MSYIPNSGALCFQRFKSKKIINNFKVLKKFENSIAIEPGKKMYEFLNNKINNLKHIKLFDITLESFLKKHGKDYENSFDLITLVHSIYFLKDPKNELKKL